MREGPRPKSINAKVFHGRGITYSSWCLGRVFSRKRGLETIV
jgi:hypothetical protein